MPVPVVSILAAVDYQAQLVRAADLLLGGGVVVLPTETVYGAAGLLTSAAARDRLRALRGGGGGPPLTIHLARPQDAYRYLGDVGELGQRLVRKVWPGPVGLMFDVPADRRAAVADELNVPQSQIYDATGAITLRCPDDFVAAGVIGLVGGPVALTRAVAHGQPFQPELAAGELDGKVDLILDAGATPYSKPSTILKVNPDGYEIVRQGVYDERIIEKLLKTTVLFVCSGNTCRSPMAESLARSLLAEQAGVSEEDLEKRGVMVLSAGAFAMPGAKATPQAVEAVRTLGADLSNHRSRLLTPELIHQADAIFTMGRAHAAAAIAMVPSAADRVATLDPEGDIEDPIGGDLSLYQELAGQLSGLIERRLREREILPFNPDSTATGAASELKSGEPQLG